MLAPVSKLDVTGQSREDWNNREGQTDSTPVYINIYLLGLQKGFDVTLNSKNRKPL